MQGKQEQAEAIRKTILRQKNVPWTVLDVPGLERLLAKVFVEKAPGRKPSEQLSEFAIFHGEAILSTHLASMAGVQVPSRAARESLQQRILAPFAARKFRDVLRQCEEYGPEYRIPMGLTPLMAASAAGNVELVKAWSHLPPSVLRPERNKRQHLSAVLSRNEVDRDYAYSRRLFKRVQQGWYVLNPCLSMRQVKGETEAWAPLPQALNLALAREFAQPAFWGDMDAFYAAVGLPEPPPPILKQPFEAAEAERVRTLAARTGWRQ